MSASFAATNKDLEEEIAKGNFPRTFSIVECDSFLCTAFAGQEGRYSAPGARVSAGVRRQYGRPRIEMSDEAIAVLKQYHWPGNVRELRNVIERVMILNPQTIRIERKHLPMLVFRGSGRKGEEFSTLHQAREVMSAITF